MIFNSWTDAIGKTPLVRLSQLDRDLPARVALKLEYTNPLGSLKDRIALPMIERAEASGQLKKGMKVIEATNGNTGIALAAVCSAKGYPLTVVMPETMSIERRILLQLLGAEIFLTPGPMGLLGSFAKVAEVMANDSSYYFINQGENAANPEAHHQTAQEIWEDTSGQVDVVVNGVGTGGSFRGLGDALKKLNPKIQMILVEPAESAVFSGKDRGPHQIPGIGPGIVPPFLESVVPDGVESISSAEAMQTARRVLREEGLPVGTSSGAVIAVALRLAAREENRGKLIVTFAASQVERYLSTPLVEEERKIAETLEVSPVDPKFVEQVLLQREKVWVKK